LLDIKLHQQRSYDEYTDSLKLMYGENTIADAISLLEGEDNFYGLHSPGLSLEGFSTHKKLLQGYAKLHRAKQQNWV
jgi:ribosomal protein S12 methylthiotransferase accessory factor